MPLDHFLLGVSDLERGIAFVEEHTGVRAEFGGVHPGRGTRNALLSLGEQYLEIIAPDPEQKHIARYTQLPALKEPKLVGWVVRTDDVAAVAQKVKTAGLEFVGPSNGSRLRSDGSAVRWKTVQLNDDRKGLLPFFIEWERETVHPAQNSPAGCRLESFSLRTPAAAELATLLEKLGAAASVEKANAEQLRLRIAGPRGALEVTS